MAEIDTKISYDREEDILDLSRGKSSQSSVEVGDFIIDIDNSGLISSIEILNASENLNIKPELLEKIRGASMQIIYNPNYVHISIEFNLRDKDKEIVIPLTLNLGHKQSRTEKMIFVR